MPFLPPNQQRQSTEGTMMMMMMMMSTTVVFIISDPGLNLCIFFRTACASQYQKSREIVPE